MAKSNRAKQFDPQVEIKLRELANAVRSGTAYQAISTRLLSVAERRALEAYPEEETIVDYWCRVKRVGPVRAVIELAHEIGLINDLDQRWLLRETGEGEPASPESDIPIWNRTRGELTFRGEVVRHVPRIEVAKNIVAILDAFQERAWPESIGDPLPEGPDSQRKRETIASLNKRLTRIRFHSAGTELDIRWTVV